MLNLETPGSKPDNLYAGMNLLDIIIGLVLILGAIRGFQKGFFREAATLLGLLGGVFVALIFAGIAGSMAQNLVEWNVRIVQVVAFVIAFVVVVLLLKLLGNLLTDLFKALMLGFVNRLAGFVIGLLKWALILTILFVFIDLFDTGNRIISNEMRHDSYLYSQLEILANMLLNRLDPHALPENFLVTCL